MGAVSLGELPTDEEGEMLGITGGIGGREDWEVGRGGNDSGGVVIVGLTEEGIDEGVGDIVGGEIVEGEVVGCGNVGGGIVGGENVGGGGNVGDDTVGGEIVGGGRNVEGRVTDVDWD